MAHPKGTIVVTGANGGLGSAIATCIAKSTELAAHHGIYTVRNASSAPALQAGLKHNATHPHDIVSLDLSSLAQVRETAAALKARVAAGEIPPIRALILNAGYQEMRDEQGFSVDGFDMTFASNYLGHWLLVMLLLQSMDRDVGRIVVLGSMSHDPRDPANATFFYEEKRMTIIHDSIDPIAKGTWSPNGGETPAWHAGFQRYAASKLCQILMIKELQRRLDADPVLKNISILGVDPGTMATGIVRSGPWVLRVLIFKILLPYFGRLLSWFIPAGSVRTTDKSASHVLEAAFECGPPYGEKPKGLYLDNRKPGHLSREAQDESKERLLWQDTLRYTALKEGETALVNWR